MEIKVLHATMIRAKTLCFLGAKRRWTSPTSVNDLLDIVKSKMIQINSNENSPMER